MTSPSLLVAATLRSAGPLVARAALARPAQRRSHATAADWRPDLPARASGDDGRDSRPLGIGGALADLASTEFKDSRPMLILHGLSPNLKPSDFYRLGSANGAWRNVIKKVQQQRDLHTLEPCGTYHVSFTSAAHATTYRDALVRLHRLSRHRLQSSTPLWENTVPEFLRSSAAVDPADELAAFTIVPAACPSLSVERKRVNTRKSWSTRLLARLGPDATTGNTPPAVLLHLYPSTRDARLLRRLIDDDGAARGCPWRVSKLLSLQTVGEEEFNRAAVRSASSLETQQSRFLVAFATESEARRFHRRWNQQTLTTNHRGSESQHRVDASVIIW